MSLQLSRPRAAPLRRPTLHSHLNLKTFYHALYPRDLQEDGRKPTTVGLKGCMKVSSVMPTSPWRQRAKQAQEIKTMMEGVYHKSRRNTGSPTSVPAVRRWRVTCARSGAWRPSTSRLRRARTWCSTNRRILTRRFFDSAVSKVRAIFKAANRETDQWLKNNPPSPMEAQVREHQIQCAGGSSPSSDPSGKRNSGGARA